MPELQTPKQIIHRMWLLTLTMLY